MYSVAGNYFRTQSFQTLFNDWSWKIVSDLWFFFLCFFFLPLNIETFSICILCPIRIYYSVYVWNLTLKIRLLKNIGQLVYPLNPILHLRCSWKYQPQASGGQSTSRCESRSQILNHTSAHQRGTSGHQCNMCSSKCLWIEISQNQVCAGCNSFLLLSVCEQLSSPKVCVT